MSLLTPEQRAIFDETVRLRALEVLNGGEEPIASPLPPDARIKSSSPDEEESSEWSE